MCNFFSLLSDGAGKIFFFDYSIRDKIIKGKLTVNNNKINSTDSHTSIAVYFNLDEDMMNKWEYNVFTKTLNKDTLNNKNDYEEVYKKVSEIDFKEIVPELIIKPDIHPFRDVPKVTKITEEHLKLLNNWASVRASVCDYSVCDYSVCDYSVRDYVWASVRASVRASVWDSVWASVRASVWDSVWDSVCDSVWDSSVWDSVCDSVWASSVWDSSVRDSVWDSVWAYVSSYFDLKKWKYREHEEWVNPFQSAIDLWKMGLVPSYDKKTWRLHSGKNADVVWEGSVERLENLEVREKE
jgi:hypothetical protein